MESLFLPFMTFAIFLHITLVITVLAIGHTLRRSVGRSCSWIALFLFLDACASFAGPHLTKQLADAYTGASIGQFFATLGYIEVLLHQLAAFGLIALVLADLSRILREANAIGTPSWLSRFDSVRRHSLGIGLATALFAIAQPVLLAGFLVTNN